MGNSARFAQRILSLVTTPDRAAATVGDLMEEPSRGRWRFWSGVSRTALSLLWDEIAAGPAHLAGLGVRGFLLNAMLLAGSILGYSALLGLIGGSMAMGMNAQASVPAPGNAPLPWWGYWLSGLMGILLYAACDFQVGRWVARRAPGKEVAACVVMRVVESAVLSLIGIAYELTRTGRIDVAEILLGLTVLQVPALVWHLPCFTGAVLVRRERNLLGNRA
jgi:hypothetical protein